MNDDFNLLKKANQKFTWFTLFEFWNNATWTGESFPFRVSVNLQKQDKLPGSKLTIGVHGQTYQPDGSFTTIWEKNNLNFDIPIGKWVTAEIFYREGNKQNGQFTLFLTPAGKKKKVIINVLNFTHHPSDPSPNGVAHFNPMKLYTSAALINYIKSKKGELNILWDDFEIRMNPLIKNVPK